ncbi:DUF4159 domain-containing protein [Cognatishimia activa]|uniref:DUF4159 domain-containing protein n=1 Tax=Cognatishimia activa TaxID=1715691 RepID=A0A975ELZ1_9RHOB|nr:DUF4159 domain-containing protein [Cognatishimia activa]QTN34485.1 DUF4159 domain-containing protein [Cognatishimia activa]
MFGLPLAFTTPWLLSAFVALPVLWILLRAVPPAPIRRRFPGVALLLGLQDDESVMDRTPWWLLLLRMLLIAALILGLAGPVLNPEERSDSDAPLLVVLDGGWASGPAWAEQSELLESTLREADRSGRDAALLRLTDPQAVGFLPAGALVRRIPDAAPLAWLPDDADVQAVLAEIEGRAFDSVWFSDGLEFEGRDRLRTALQAAGQLRVVQSSEPVLAIQSVGFDDGILTATVRRSAPVASVERQIEVKGLDPNGVDRTLARAALRFDGADLQTDVSFSLPSELRGRITQFAIEGLRSAGAVYLTDDALKRREVAIISTRDDREGLELLSPSHYLRQALVETTELIEAAIPVVIPANPDVIILADIATLAPAEEEALIEWTQEGGLLLRFAGPQMAASDLSRSEEHPLMPVRLRAGGRSVGGAMSWGEPKTLAPFTEDSPFFGLPLPEDVRVTAQVVAQPDPSLADRVLAELSDGTPLVTRKAVGQGQVVLFHVSANAEWSGLPLSGLFVQMLDRLAVLSAKSGSAADVMDGTIWQPLQVMDGLGRLSDAKTLSGIAGEVISQEALGPDVLPGLYQNGEEVFARNVFAAGDGLKAFEWPASVTIEGLEQDVTRDLTSWFLMAALALLAIDTVLSLMLSGRLSGLRAAPSALAALALLGATSTDLGAQEAPRLTDEIALGYVVTGDQRIDDMSYAGLYGLSNVLFSRTSIEPVPPEAVDLETSELAFFPFLYWPISPDQPLPSGEAYAKLNQYLRSGGMILFDTRDADVARLGSGSPNGRKLQALAQPLDIPQLEVVPKDHVLTRTFYLLQDFPGRYASREVWVEAAPADAAQVEGMPFRNLNDGVTPVVIGGNDWASAWATNEFGVFLNPVGRGLQGERQREIAYRFGVNLIMHVLTGNYKSDQVHVPALLDRLGQ